MIDDMPERAGSARRMAQEAYRVARDEGLGAVTSRRLSAAASASLSTITQRFGSMRGVRMEIASQLIDEWNATFEAVNPQAEERFAAPDAAGFALSLIAEIVVRRPGLSLLDAELIQSDVRAEYGIMSANLYDQWATTFLAICGDRCQASAWTDFIVGLLPLALADPSLPSLWSWATTLVERLRTRFAREPDGGRPLTFSQPETFKTEPPAAGGARRILDATISLIKDEGVDGISHRKVAALAGLSVASCRFFFGTKNAMIKAAILELERRIHASIEMRIQSGKNDDELLITSVDRNEDFLTLNSLHAPIARDPTLFAVARVLRDFRGATVQERLARRVPKSDRLDAIIWSTLYIGALHPRRLSEPRTDEALRERLASHLRAIFDI